jgi:formylglycine-generating enzyme required for sulfatase activity
MQRTKERVFSLENHLGISKELRSNPIPETIISPIDGAEMVLVPDGQFSMGITEEELLQIFTLDKRETPVFVTEIPARTVYLKAYYIDGYPVTNYQYRKFI